MNEQFETVNGVAEQEESVANDGGSKNLLQQIQEMKANGQVNTPEFINAMRKLEVILGVSQISPFGTNELEIFEQDLQEMTNTDMQRLATKVGVNPYLERPILKKTLLKEFNNQTKNSRRNIMPTAVNSFVLDPSNEKHKKLMRILGDI